MIGTRSLEEARNAVTPVYPADQSRVVQHINDQRIAELRGLATTLATIVAQENPDLTRFLVVSHRYHTAFVGFERMRPVGGRLLPAGDLGPLAQRDRTSTTTTSTSSGWCGTSSPTAAVRSDGIAARGVCSAGHLDDQLAGRAIQQYGDRRRRVGS
jgi:hypothetical protein